MGAGGGARRFALCSLRRRTVRVVEVAVCASGVWSKNRRRSPPREAPRRHDPMKTSRLGSKTSGRCLGSRTRCQSPFQCDRSGIDLGNPKSSWDRDPVVASQPVPCGSMQDGQVRIRDLRSTAPSPSFRRVANSAWWQLSLSHGCVRERTGADPRFTIDCPISILSPCG